MTECGRNTKRNGPPLNPTTNSGGFSHLTPTEWAHSPRFSDSVPETTTQTDGVFERARMRETWGDGIFTPSVGMGIEKRGLISYHNSRLRARDQQSMTEGEPVEFTAYSFAITRDRWLERTQEAE